MADTAFNRHILSLPGLWIQHDDRDWAGDVQLLLGSAVDQFAEALVAFDLFKPFTAADVRRDPQGALLAEDPVELRRRFIYAKAFVYDLDASRSFVHVIASVSTHSSVTVAACNELLQQFGYIRDIRNSLQHIEERIQGKGSRGKKRLGPIVNLGSLNERRFGVTTGDGHQLEIDISEDFIIRFRSALSDVLWSLDWVGPGNTLIRRCVSDA